jgi:VWFA-related protein
MSFQKISSFFVFQVFLLAFAVCANAQTPSPTPPEDDTEKIFTEEIKINVLAFDQSGKFAANVVKEDLVIAENGRLHQATSLRRIPANVLIVLDVGNEISFGKRNKMTADAAKALVGALQAEDSVAVMQYGDKVEILAEWTQDKAFLYKILDEKKLGYGKRSVFNQALDSAVKFFDKTPRENRHLILITDGVDSFNDQKVRSSAMRNLLSSDINVHVISYTVMQEAAIEPKKSIWLRGEPKPQRLPEEVLITLPQSQQQILRMPRIGSINTDREMIKKRKEESAKIKASEQFLTSIAEDTNGEIFLPVDKDEMAAKTETLARNIDSQYVATYTPKKPLSESNDGEVRNIEITSRRTDIQVQGKRKFVVNNRK